MTEAKTYMHKTQCEAEKNFKTRTHCHGATSFWDNNSTNPKNMHLTSVYTLTNSLTHIQLDVVAFITFFQSVSILKPSVKCSLCSFSIFFWFGRFVCQRNLLPRTHSNVVYFCMEKIWLQSKKLNKKPTKQQTKNFVVYIQRRMMESNDRLLQEKGTQITLRHTHAHSYFYVCMLRYLHLFIHSVHDSEVLPISCRRSQTRKQHKKYGIK